MPRHYRPVPYHLRKRRPSSEMPKVTEIQSLTDGTIVRVGKEIVEDDLGDWIDKNWGATPPAPKPKGLNDARYYVSATSGRTGWNPSFEGFGVFDAQNHEYCVYASYTLGNAERRCKLMNDVDQGLRQRYEIVRDSTKKDWWHVVDIYHDHKPMDIRWVGSGRQAECEAQAKLMNDHDRKKR